ncbi:MAG TPA: thioredoxin domain-containing protein, partial [Planctomycetota bacterium]|nr:thioredoxin domain-containing protein [Planctomycetota bacterium]
MAGDETPRAGAGRRNRLAGETSPYLLQHAGNPVDWYPWGPEALERARAEDRPIFLSIGYSACHWCPVMERESFEDPRVAELLAEYFVSVKVDREERPDIDELYMKAVTSTTGSGGWPMSVFLTPELEPFFCGTYFPPVRQYGRPSFRELVVQFGESWRRDREAVARRGQQVTAMLQREARAPLAGELDPAVLDRSLAMLAQAYDDAWGGFGGPPKFPHAMDVRLCLRHHARTRNPRALAMARRSLAGMARGGLYDQLGGGFHRYSTDERWLIPHFEKMLYDNALLVPAYLEGWLVTRDELFARTARGACEWMLGEMRTPEGAFASTQDADSEGEEGRFFVWTPAELETVLGRELGRRAAAWWGVTDAGNFEHGA